MKTKQKIDNIQNGLTVNKMRSFDAYIHAEQLYCNVEIESHEKIHRDFVRLQE